MINSEIQSISIDEFLQRVGAQPDGNIWSTLVASSSDFGELVEDLRETISIFAECEVEVISAEAGSLDLIRRVQEASEDYLVIWNFEGWSQDRWIEFDYARSLITRKRGGVLVLSFESVKSIFTYAPNFANWLGSRVYDLNKNRMMLTIDERQARLSALREWSGLSDSEVLKRASARELPLDPEYGEWLVLLDRGDLIERSR